ncbi:MAG: PqqD family protein [Planctomycetota bacterium]
MNYLINPQVIFRKIEGEYYILEPSTNMFINFNEVGNIIFDMITQGKSQHEIVDTLLQLYDTDETTLKSDLEEFIEELKKLHILT